MSTKTATPTLPKGWSVELQGLSASVLFTKGHRSLYWCDGTWQTIVTNERGSHAMTARGVPHADTMTEARRVGTAFLAMVEEDDDQ